MNRRRFFQFAAAAVAARRLRSQRRLNIGQLEASTSCFADMTMLEAVAAARRLGFAGIEILTFTNGKHSVGPLPGAVVQDLSGEDRRKVLDAVRTLPHVTTHLPFYGVYPAAHDPAMRKAALQHLHAAIDDSAYWGASVATMHAAIEPGHSLEECRSDLVTALRELGDHAGEKKVRLGVETGGGGPNTVEGYLELIRAVNHAAVGGTVDTGHEIAYKADLHVSDEERGSPAGARRYNEILLEVVRGLGPKLFHFHLDDVNARSWREHRTLGTGIVDWRKLLRFLSDSGYSGLFALELEETPPLETAAISRKFLEEQISSL
jgi:sugar phosphate isomerase/epimerase